MTPIRVFFCCLALLVAAASCPASPYVGGFDSAVPIRVGSDGRAIGFRAVFPDYDEGSRLLVSTPGAFGGSAAGFWNPAAWAAMREFELSFYWNDRNVAKKRMDHWGFALGGEGIGFSMRRNNFRLIEQNDTTSAHVDDYQVAVGGGTRLHYWGLAYHWSRGRGSALGRDHALSLGTIVRPCRFASIGHATMIALDEGEYRFLSDIGLRPLGAHCVTVFADADYGQHDNFSSLRWGTGVELQPVNGVRVAAKMSKPLANAQDKLYSVSLGISLDGVGFHVVPHYDKDSKRTSTSYMARLGGMEPTLSIERFTKKGKRVVSLPMKGVVTYQKALWFDRDRRTLIELVRLIENAKKDPTVGGMVMNFSGLEISRELAWELREKLKDFQGAGKKVYVYLDRAEMSSYYLASVADYVWIDPSGMIMIPGYAAGRTFWKNFLTKLGLGAEEFRYFAYKSAFEQYTRTNMSEKDREQRRVMIEDFFAEWSQALADSRRMTPDRVRDVVDSTLTFLPQAALAAGLVDTIGTWEDAKDFIEKVSGEKPSLTKSSELKAEAFADPTWGPLPKIALVYALGVCDMDEGIRGRATSRILNKLAKRRDVKAVVLRADSPGGDALPSDLVAREMKNVAQKKPMVVSQGSVAASGGYWISMNGTRIFTSPMTVTGSIGVIGGWIWNEKFSEKTGFTFDHVKVGTHADIGRGVTLPIIGAEIPDRNMDAEEKKQIETLIRTFYREFVGKVAGSRNLDTMYVDSIGQGRVWAGRRAVELKLCDEIGTLDQAISYAREQGKISKRRRYELVEYPKRSLLPGDLFTAPSPIQALARALAPTATATRDAADYELIVLKKMAESPGVPLFMIPPEDVPLE